MKIVDLNILLYAVSPSFDQHIAVNAWWNNAMIDEEPIGLPWIVLAGFIRLATNPRVFPRPLPVVTALNTIEAWLTYPNTRLVQETDNHWRILRELLENTGAAGHLTTDAHLATMAISHGAILVSCDNDFARFNGLRWQNPLRKSAQ